MEGDDGGYTGGGPGGHNGGSGGHTGGGSGGHTGGGFNAGMDGHGHGGNGDHLRQNEYGGLRSDNINQGLTGRDWISGLPTGGAVPTTIAQIGINMELAETRDQVINKMNSGRTFDETDEYRLNGPWSPDRNFRVPGARGCGVFTPGQAIGRETFAAFRMWDERANSDDLNGMIMPNAIRAFPRHTSYIETLNMKGKVNFQTFMENRGLFRGEHYCMLNEEVSTTFFTIQFINGYCYSYFLKISCDEKTFDRRQAGGFRLHPLDPCYKWSCQAPIAKAYCLSKIRGNLSEGLREPPKPCGWYETIVNLDIVSQIPNYLSKVNEYNAVCLRDFFDLNYVRYSRNMPIDKCWPCIKGITKVENIEVDWLESWMRQDLGLEWKKRQTDTMAQYIIPEGTVNPLGFDGEATAALNRKLNISGLNQTEGKCELLQQEINQIKDMMTGMAELDLKGKLANEKKKVQELEEKLKEKQRDNNNAPEPQHIADDFQALDGDKPILIQEVSQSKNESFSPSALEEQTHSVLHSTQRGDGDLSIKRKHDSSYTDPSNSYLSQPRKLHTIDKSKREEIQAPDGYHENQAADMRREAGRDATNDWSKNESKLEYSEAQDISGGQNYSADQNYSASQHQQQYRAQFFAPPKTEQKLDSQHHIQKYGFGPQVIRQQQVRQQNNWNQHAGGNNNHFNNFAPNQQNRFPPPQQFQQQQNNQQYSAGGNLRPNIPQNINPGTRWGLRWNSVPQSLDEAEKKNNHQQRFSNNNNWNPQHGAQNRFNKPPRAQNPPSGQRATKPSTPHNYDRGTKSSHPSKEYKQKKSTKNHGPDKHLKITFDQHKSDRQVIINKNLTKNGYESSSSSSSHGAYPGLGYQNPSAKRKEEKKKMGQWKPVGWKQDEQKNNDWYYAKQKPTSDDEYSYEYTTASEIPDDRQVYLKPEQKTRKRERKGQMDKFGDFFDTKKMEQRLDYHAKALEKNHQLEQEDFVPDKPDSISALPPAGQSMPHQMGLLPPGTSLNQHPI